MTAEHYTSDMMLLIQEYVIYVMMTIHAPESKQFERDYEKIVGVNTVFRMLSVCTTAQSRPRQDEPSARSGPQQPKQCGPRTATDQAALVKCT